MLKCVAVLLLAIFLVACGSGSSSSNYPQTTEEKLVVIDSAYGAQRTESTIAEYKRLLDALTSQYSGTREEIADQTSRAQGVLHDEGINMSTRAIMHDMELPKRPEVVLAYKEAIVMYLMIKTKK